MRTAYPPRRADAWGEEGYIRLEFNANTCGVANEATLAIVSVGGPSRRKD